MAESLVQLCHSSATVPPLLWTIHRYDPAKAAENPRIGLRPVPYFATACRYDSRRAGRFPRESGGSGAARAGITLGTPQAVG